VTTDPFEQLRVDDEPGTPDRRFVAALRRRVTAALTADLPTIDLPQRSSPVSDATTTTTASPTAPAAVTSTITPYLCVAGAAAAMTWYADVLGAVEQVRYTGDDGRIGHGEMTIGGARFMLSDEYPEMGVPVQAPTTIGGTPFSMHVEVPDVDAVHARVVADGRALVGRAPHDEAYGARSFDMVDPFGHRWMVQTPIAQPTPEEIEAEMAGYTITVAETATTPAPAPVEIGYVTFGAPDTTVAARFYGALFGWAVEPGASGDEYAHVANTALPMGLAPGRADEAPVVYFRVDDVARYAARVRELGGEVVSEATYDSGPNAVCRDDQGREFQLWQPAPGYA
jgi:uncharacterized glyoxalase superfamily protein PhnB